ncbi:A/G-specific adenine glycosylase [Pseudooceanicola batsensis HTCC2597]|uniref:Adenine DNA glycosylase n=1 Tax=Pseudooceanicola batsensis (strain ATCC BAA-863 / DSM 15984 / KCTC 12145 / HTCC2597) TaxID=252305 RepID=A3U247_PSEBH|nr:A/G-specific adenine glycosylase [Pseudooceanicola batsensis]EAQ01647.1 A/G-specific adenine glycosylase [Pseudooceanicola batsensis HTCC2597]
MRDDDAAGQARSDTLLEWYDRHARDLPWRVPPGAARSPDPYRIWLSEVMLQQTTVAAVRAYFERFTQLWPTVADLAQADDGRVMAEWAGLGYYARARNLLKCARVVAAEHQGRFPDRQEDLLKLPGIGPYTAAAIAAIAFDRPAVVMDGNVERVMARLHDIHTPLPAAKPELKAEAAALTPAARPGDYAQAVMDLGATICTPRSPACGICPWRAPCLARARGTAAVLPRKAPKKAKPVRLGIAYVGRTPGGDWLLERRPDSGLLGGMLGWPGSPWAETTPAETPPVAARWCDVGAEARHTFTHFHLRLALRVAVIDPAQVPADGPLLLVPKHRFRPSDLPTVMRKAFDLAHGAMESP